MSYAADKQTDSKILPTVTDIVDVCNNKDTVAGIDLKLCS